MTFSRQRLSVVFIVFFAILLGGLSFSIFLPFLLPIVWAFILWRVFDRPHETLAAKLHGRRTFSATIMTLGIIVGLVMPLSYVGAVATTQLMQLYEAGKEWVTSGELAKLPERAGQMPIVGPVSQELLSKVIGPQGQVDPPPEAAALGKSVAGTMGKGAKQLAEGVTEFLIIFFTLFFLFRDSLKVYKTVDEALPIDPKVKIDIAECLDEAVVAVVRSTLLTAVGQGMVAGVTYWLLDLPMPLLLGALSAVASLIPVGGTALVWGPLALYLLVTGAVWKALILIVVGIGIVGLMDNVVRPLLVGTGVDLPSIVVFFASLGGLAWWGFLGLFVGPIVLAMTKAVFHILLRMYHRSLRHASASA